MGQNHHRIRSSSQPFAYPLQWCEAPTTTKAPSCHPTLSNQELSSRDLETSIIPPHLLVGQRQTTGQGPHRYWILTPHTLKKGRRAAGVWSCCLWKGGVDSDLFILIWNSASKTKFCPFRMLNKIHKALHRILCAAFL